MNSPIRRLTCLADPVGVPVLGGTVDVLKAARQCPGVLLFEFVSSIGFGTYILCMNNILRQFSNL